MVTGTDANGATETVPANHTLFRQPDDGPVAFIRRGGTIADYEAPPVPFKALSRPAFLFMMSKIGVTEAAVEQLIAGMPEGTQTEQDAKALALIVFKNTTTFERTNQLLNTLTAAYGLTTDQVDAAWQAAEQIVW
jgi:hypothetical protein